MKKEPLAIEEFTFLVLSKDGVAWTSSELPPRRDSLTMELVTPTSPSQASPLKIVRWPDATPSPTIRVIRHGSQLLEPTLQTSNPMPIWGWRTSGVGKQDMEGVEDVKENMVVVGTGKWNGMKARN